MTPRRFLPNLASYVVALALSLLATVLNLALQPMLEQSPTLLYTVAVVVSAWRGGLGPGILASVLATGALAYFFVEPLQSLAVDGLGSVLRLAVFLFVASMMGGAAALKQRAESDEREQRAHLEMRVRERTLELEAATTQLRALAASLEATREEERLRLSREVHDVLGSALTGMKMDVARLRKRAGLSAEADASLESLSADLDQMVTVVRRIASDLRPSVLDDLGLAAAVEWQLEEFSRRTGLEVQLAAEPTADVLAPEVATAVFRVFQEALTNIARHAQATRVEVNIAAQSGALRVQIRDDGCGFELQSAAQRRTFGLVGMRERMRLLAGHIVIHSRPGQGTRVDIHVPVTAPPAAGAGA
jgi:signal transduction histidine kinase